MCRVSGEVPITGPTSAEVAEHLRTLPKSETPWESPPSEARVSFLAQGEYSLNYVVGSRDSESLYVARLITGTQMGLALGDQARYEHHALGLVAASGVTPTPYLVDPEPVGLPYPMILEGYLPGRPLEYATDLRTAARCVAAVHALGVPERHHLHSHPDPAPAVLAESARLLEPYLEWEGAAQESKLALGEAFERIREFQEVEGLFEPDDLAIVNYDLNTHNFVVERGEARLLDWEKARIAPRTEDVAHFLLPTTTLWRDETATRLTREQEREFLDEYASHAGVVGRERFETQLTAVRIMISLRAVSWCAWALQAHERGERPAGEEMLDKARTYLEPEFLRDLFGLER